MQHLFPDSGVYNVDVVFDVTGMLDTAAFAHALLSLEERHHALRLRVTQGADGRLFQRLAPAGNLIPAIIDLTGETSLAEADARLAAEPSRKSLNRMK